MRMDRGAFDSAMVIDFCKDFGVHMMFLSIVHPQANRQADSTNKVFLKGLKKKLDGAKCP